MANMGYCRFQNTLGDLRDCADHLTELEEKQLSEDERHAAIRLLEMCKEITESFGYLAEPFCSACQQHKPCSCDNMAADRRGQ